MNSPVFPTRPALASRFLMFRFRRSFLGKEDRELDGRLRSELPGILLWAMEGRRRLLDRGKFLQPGSGEADLEQIRDFNSPVGAWVRERAAVGDGLRVDCDTAFTDWKQWCELNNVERAGNKQTFSRNLRAVFPSWKPSQYRIGKDDGERICEGVHRDRAEGKLLNVRRPDLRVPRPSLLFLGFSKLRAKIESHA